jgi:hypothetical protein
MDLQRSSWLLELQQVYVLLSSFVPLIMLWDPSAFISISHNAVVVSCNMDNSIWIKNATQHNPGMKFWQKEHIVQLCFHLMLLSRSGGGAFTLCICLVPSQEYDFINYLKMRLVFLYTLLGRPASAHYQCLSAIQMMKKMNCFCRNVVSLNPKIESHCVHLELNFNSIQFNLTINGIKIQLNWIQIQLKKNQMQIVREVLKIYLWICYYGHGYKT